jgi:8-oxo-dGTP diphosphatase
MDGKTIKIVAALIRDETGRILLVRKRGTQAFMQPGGKRDPGEDDITALSREVAEELGCRLVPSSIRPLGHFEAIAANEPGFGLQASLYAAELVGQITPSGEIEETIWLNPASPSNVPLAPLTRDHVLPLAVTWSKASGPPREAY